MHGLETMIRINDDAVIRRLRAEAADDGLIEIVALCDEALEGVPESRRRALLIIEEA